MADDVSGECDVLLSHLACVLLIVCFGISVVLLRPGESIKITGGKIIMKVVARKRLTSGIGNQRRYHQVS